jgi:hypothetical protein
MSTVTGTDLVREEMRGRNRKLNLARTEKDLGMIFERVEAFVAGRIALDAATIQALVKLIWHGHVAFDSELGLLRPSNGSLPRPLGISPPPFDASGQPKYVAGGPPPLQTGYASPNPKQKRAGWLCGWLT